MSDHDQKPPGRSGWEILGITLGILVLAAGGMCVLLLWSLSGSY